MFSLMLSSPFRAGVVPVCDCPLPSWLNGYALATKEFSTLDLHHVDRAILVGGNVSCGDRALHSVIIGSNGKNPVSFVGGQGRSDCSFNFAPSVELLSQQHKDELRDRWVGLENIALDITEKSYQSNDANSYASYLIKKVDQGGQYDQGVSGCHMTIDMAQVRVENPLHAEDDGKTLLVLTGEGTVCLTNTNEGRQFGPSVLAPFAHIETTDSVGFVDGYIIARSAHLRGSGTQLHGEAYSGPMSCRGYEVCGFASPSSVPSTIPSSDPSSAPSNSPTAKPTGMPTGMPTHSPSAKPTANPSVSHAPSISPTLSPLPFTTIYLSELTGTYNFYGAASVGTEVVFAPTNAKFVGVFDTATSAFSTVPSSELTGIYKFYGAASVGTEVVFAPFDAKFLGVFDTTTSAFSTVPSSELTGTKMFTGAASVGTEVVFAPDANVVGVLETALV